MYFNENFSPSLRAKRYGYGFGGYPGFGGGYPGFGCCGYGTEVYIVYILNFYSIVYQEDLEDIREVLAEESLFMVRDQDSDYTLRHLCLDDEKHLVNLKLNHIHP